MDSRDLIRKLTTMGLMPYAFTSYRAHANVVAVFIDGPAELYRLGQALVGFDLPEMRIPRQGFELYWKNLKWPEPVDRIDALVRDFDLGLVSHGQAARVLDEIGGKVDHGEPRSYPHPEHLG